MNNDIMRVIIIVALLVIIAVGLALMFIFENNPFVFLCLVIPAVTFIIIFFFMEQQRKRVERLMKDSFGQNVVKIATAIMSYFEFPLTLLLTLILTLFFFSFALIAALFWTYKFV